MRQNLQLFLNNAKSKNRQSGKSTVIAFTAAESGEGTTFVSNSFAIELSRRAGKRTLIADARQLARVNMVHQSRVSQHCFQTEVPNLWTLPSEEDFPDIEAEAASDDWGLKKYGAASEFELLESNLETLRGVFDYILLDCPPLAESDEAIVLAPDSDGVVIVVEADTTRREQIQNAQKTIERAEGNLLGFVLNKRRYTVPNWIYKRL